MDRFHRRPRRAHSRGRRSRGAGDRRRSRRVEDPDHRSTLADAVAAHGALDLLVNNASSLGPSPLPDLLDLSPDELTALLEVNVVAPLALVQRLTPSMVDDAVVVDISSDAAVEPYPGWGGYGASKAALDHLTRILAVESPDLRVYAVDPGDMRTADAPGRPSRARTSRTGRCRRPCVPALLALLDAADRRAAATARRSWRQTVTA